MKKRIFGTVFTVFMLMMLLAQSVFAVTSTHIIKPEYNEDTVIFASFKDGQKIKAEYIYTGEKIKPEIIVTKFDKSVAEPSEYKVTYDDDCQNTGHHYIRVEYLKNNYVVTLTYDVVPGTTSKVDMTAKNGSVTLSWAAVKGANGYRVYKLNSSTGNYVEIPWEDGSIASEKLSRTFTDLAAGKTYNMAIMALSSVNSMPSKQMKTFKFTVPQNGEGSLNIVPGVNKTPVVTTTKQATAAKENKTTTTTTITTTTTTQVTTTESTALVETTTKQAETKPFVTEKTVDTTAVSTSKEDNSNLSKIIPILIVVAVIAVAIIVLVVLKKKKK